MFLACMNHCTTTPVFDSDLGIELNQLQARTNSEPLDPTSIKNIIVTAEDTRVASRLSELAIEISDKDELERRTTIVENMRLNLYTGQQCVRDFFGCIEENIINKVKLLKCHNQINCF